MRRHFCALMCMALSLGCGDDDLSSDAATDSMGSDATSEIDAASSDGGPIDGDDAGGLDAGGADTSTGDAGGADTSTGDAGPAMPCGEGRPGPDNTGPDDTPLTRMDGRLEITTPGMVIENVEIHGPVQIKADNVTLRNFRIVGGLYGIQMTYGAENIRLENGEIDGAMSAGVYGSNFTARCLDIHDIGGDGFKTIDNTLVEYTWVHHIGTTDDAHADGNQTRGGANNTFRFNYCDMGVSVPAPYKSNACFILQEPNDSVIDNFVIEDNWLDGGNYTIYCAGTTYVRRNRFGRDYRFGIATGGCTEWSGNVWDDDGTPAE